MKFIINLVLNALAIMLAAYLLPGIHVDGFTSAIMLALVLSLLNVTLKPVMVILTIPVSVVTLGLFLIVINAGVILLADYFIPGTNIDGFWWAILFGLVVSIVNSILYSLAGTK